MKKAKSTPQEAQGGTQKEADDLPSISEIALLAATLISGNPKSVIDECDAARRTIKLWQASKEELNIAKNKNAKRAEIRAEESKKHDALPKPKKFPVPFKELLILALPKKRLKERMKTFDDAVRFNLQSDRRFPRPGGNLIPFEEIQEVTDNDVSKAKDEHRKNGFDEIPYEFWVRLLRKCADDMKKDNRKAAGLKSAQAKKKSKADAAGGKNTS